MSSAPSINLIVAVTDDDWFNLLRRKPDLKEVNFWAPSDATFKALKPGVPLGVV
jgi:putative restriction endonuclease